MSDYSASPARPVSLFTIIVVLVLFAAFLFFVRRFYQPATLPPQNLAVENLSKDLEWRATAESRRKALADQRQEDAKRVSSYGWVDQKSGKVQLPIERAMELTVQQHGAKR
jgi:hypothetical protein